MHTDHPLSDPLIALEPNLSEDGRLYPEGSLDARLNGQNGVEISTLGIRSHQESKESVDLLNVLIGFFAGHYWKKSLAYLKDGRFDNGLDISSEGEENKSFPSMLIIADGGSLPGRLKDDHIILDRNLPSFYLIRSEEDLGSYLKENRNKDGVFVYNGDANEIGRVRRFVNDLGDEVRERAINALPQHFVYRQTDDTSESVDDLGTKRSLALELCERYKNHNVNAFLISQSAYGNTLAGSIIHISPEGVAHRVYLEHDPHSSAGVFFDKENGIRMIVEEYKPIDGVATAISSRRIDGTPYKETYQCEGSSRSSLYQTFIEPLFERLSPSLTPSVSVPNPA